MTFRTLLLLSNRMGAAKLQPIPGRPDPMLKRWLDYAHVLQPGASGNITVDRFTLSVWGYAAPPGDYIRLKIDGGTMMSSTPDEYRSNYDVVNQAQGDVLIAGLGLGVVPHCILDRPQVRSITVVEKSADVIALVGSQFQHDKLTIIEADIRTWTPPAGTKFNCIYFDIWPAVRPSYLPEIAALHQRFGPYLDGTDPDAWLDSWQADFVRAAVAHYLGSGRVEAPPGWTQTPPALLAMAAEDLQGVSA